MKALLQEALQGCRSCVGSGMLGCVFCCPWGNATSISNADVVLGSGDHSSSNTAAETLFNRRSMLKLGTSCTAGTRRQIFVHDVLWVYGGIQFSHESVCVCVSVESLSVPVQTF